MMNIDDKRMFACMGGLVFGSFELIILMNYCIDRFGLLHGTLIAIFLFSGGCAFTFYYGQVMERKGPNELEHQQLEQIRQTAERNRINYYKNLNRAYVEETEE